MRHVFTSDEKKVQQGPTPPKPAAHPGSGSLTRRILGPVADLEQHVPSDWWRYIFNYLYLKTDADVIGDPNITRQEVDLVVQHLRPAPEAKILDLACGQGRHSIELAKRGYKNVEGLDRSHYLIQKAKSRAKRDGLSVRFREGDARKIPYAADTFDVVVILGNSFGYFESAHEDQRVLEEVFRVLKPSGQLLVDVANGEYLRKNFEPRSWEWIDQKYFVCRERSLSADENRLISREVITHVEKGVIADQFYAERLYTPDSLTQLIRSAGFGGIALQGEISPDSVRNQDLGMMKLRLLVTAAAKKEWSPDRRKPKKDLTNVVIVLGDPRKPDLIKPSAVFDEDDFYTIDQLRSALGEHKEYNFVYVNDHDGLVSELMKLRPKIDLVMNLCDEGYDNDPRKELHVPSLLEVLDIPYSGSGPRCLACCYDKSLVRGVAQEMEIPVPQAFFIKSGETTFELPVDFPVIVKPNFGDSSFGITQRSVANSLDELVSAISEIRERFGYDKPILVEEFLTGKDLSVGILGNPPESYDLLPIVEEDYSSLPPELPRICGFEAKWMPDSPYWNLRSIPAVLPDDAEKLIVASCVKLFERLECHDYCRFDWRLDANGAPKLLEVNPNPGWCWDGHLAKMAHLTGISYPDMLKRILRAAEKRLARQSKESTRG
ncbi:MAG TPA: methyltransferase domain-containing protein [Candidatus Deferrimicrobium sp.]|nr:methyltransferase domain-containing protein [Candidatus Deferrimicrobium sp.]